MQQNVIRNLYIVGKEGRATSSLRFKNMRLHLGKLVLAIKLSLNKSCANRQLYVTLFDTPQMLKE